MAKNKFEMKKDPLAGNALFDTDAIETTEKMVDDVSSEPKQPKKRGKKPDPNVEKESGARQGLQKGLTRRTMIFKESTLNDLLKYADFNEMTIKDALDFIICSFMDDVRRDPDKMKETTNRLQAEKKQKMREFLNGGNKE